MLVVALTARGADRVFEAGPQKTHLIELFTSEGCSSCPSAEAWLSKLKTESGLWKDFVPLAFHVDYWDRLGWRDPFAAKEWTARQYQYAASWKSDGVYTPGLVLDGREWRERKVPTPSDEKPGVLKVSVVNEKVSAEFNPAKGEMKNVAKPDEVGQLLQPKSRPEPSAATGRSWATQPVAATGYPSGATRVDLHVALLAFDLNSKVTAGENSGRNLRQDFVVLSLANEKMAEGKTELSLKMDPRAGAIAAWITPANQLEPIQAVGGWLR